MLFGTGPRNLPVSVPRPPANKAAKRHVAKLGVTLGGSVNWSIRFFFGGLGVKMMSSIHQISEFYCGLSLPPCVTPPNTKQSTCSLWFAWARPKIVFQVQVLQSSGVGLSQTRRCKPEFCSTNYGWAASIKDVQGRTRQPTKHTLHTE